MVDRKVKKIAILAKAQFIREILGVILLASPLLLYAKFHLSCPSISNSQKVLFPGGIYKHYIDRSIPRPVSIHIVEIDLKTPGIEAVVTPPQGGKPPDEIKARTTSEFLTEFNLQIAINANFFYPFREKTPWDYYPKSGAGVNLAFECDRWLSNE